jgi:hypothetical protein
MQPQWVKDLQQMVDQIGFGEIKPIITKHRNKVTQVSVASDETIKYDDSEQALAAISRLMANLFNAQYDGEVTFRVIFENGAISRVGYYNERHTNYDQINKQKATNENRNNQRSAEPKQ